LPTRHGEFQLTLYRDEQGKDHLAFQLGEVSAQEGTLVRIHSECFTGDVLGSLRCDCGPQLEQALRRIGQAGRGVLVYLRQEGRGIGLLDKLRAYNLQDLGFDTVDANLQLGHVADAREYSVAALILRDLGLTAIDLLTNNPSKLEGLAELGIQVRRRIPLQVPVSAEGAAYLQTKQRRMNHWLDAADSWAWPEQWQPWLEGRPVPPDRPLVTVSVQQTPGGKVRTQADPAWSAPVALREWHDAVLVGIEAVLEGPMPSQLVVVDWALRLPVESEMLTRSPWIVYAPGTDVSRQQALVQRGASLLEVPLNPAGRLDLHSLLASLRQRGVGRLLVEGGRRLIHSFLAHPGVDLVVAQGASSPLHALHQVDPERVSRSLWVRCGAVGVMWAALERPSR
jgi:3,4-dihydroxy 2-butanone 4-phosphate synthase/GTP cyclohydrolase II